jgi:S-formylglutathione hydrolase FrmB
MTTSITTTRFIAMLWIVAAGTGVMIVFVRRRLRRTAVVVGAVIMLLIAASGTVNAYFDYIPTVGALLGRRARDQASAQEVAKALDAALARGHPLPSHGKVIVVSIPAERSHFHARAAQVYLPPIWFSPNRPRLPVVELIHGTPGTPDDWTRAGLADVATDDWAEKHGGVAPILLMPDANGSFMGDTECVNGSRGQAETYLTHDVREWAIATLGAARGRTSWAIGGASEGGFCALDIALRHESRYATFLDFSGLDRPTIHGDAVKLFDGSEGDLRQHTPSVLMQERRTEMPLAGWFEVGTSDGGTTRAVIAMATQARRSGIATHLVLIPHAHHTWRVWRTSYADAFPWTAMQLGLAGEVPAH